MLRVRIVLCFLLLSPFAVMGQDTPTLTEEEFLAVVTETHPAMAVLAGERELAAAEALRASLLPNPTIEASVEEPDGAARETSAAVTWTPPLGGRRALRQEVAARSLDAADSRLQAARFRLRLDLRAAYADWAFAWERRELLADHLARVGELAQRTRARAQAGEIPGLAARRFNLEEAQVRADLGRAEARLAVARAALAAWSPSIPPGARPVPIPLTPVPGTTPDLALLPDLAAREREVERAEALRRLSERIFEAPALGLGWKRIEDRTVDASGPVVSVGWSVPLFDRRQADRQEAEARLATARADLELARIRVQTERAGALAAFDRLRTEAAAAEQAAAETRELLSGASASYQLGESGLTDLFDTLRTALAARTTSLEVREAALAAQRDLEATLGRSLPGDMP